MSELNGLDTTRQLAALAPKLKARGYDFVVRYYSHSLWKNLSRAEAQAISAAGLQIGAVWESAGNHADFFNRAQGYADGQAAWTMARDRIGQPPGSAIYFAVDFDPSQGEVDGPIEDYFQAVRAALDASADGKPGYAIGVYGSGRCLSSLRGVRTPSGEALVDYFWLSQSTGFAGYGEFLASQSYHLLQQATQHLTDLGLDIDPVRMLPDKPAGLFQVPQTVQASPSLV